MKKSIYILIPLIVLTILSCRQNRYNVNINDIDLDLSITRLEKEFFEGNPADLGRRVTAFKASHIDFMRIFGYVINIGEPEDPTWDSDIIRFATDKQNVEVYKAVKEVYDDITLIEEDLTDAWKHYKYYFPAQAIPQIYTCISGFNNSVIVGENVIGLSLDRYLGADSKYYPMLGIYNYLRTNMTPEKIVPDCMFGWAAASWEIPVEASRSNKLLEHILHQGRLLYFSRLMLPELPDSLIFGFSENQMIFCDNNEDQMWEYLVEYDLLFSTDPMVIKKLTEEAPFTTYFSNESPGKAANWIGFRIVESYMSNNPKLTLSELMNLQNLNIILESSRYSP